MACARQRMPAASQRWLYPFYLSGLVSCVLWHCHNIRDGLLVLVFSLGVKGGLDVGKGGGSGVLVLVEGVGLADGLEQLVGCAGQEGLPDVLQVTHELGFAAVELLGVAVDEQVSR